MVRTTDSAVKQIISLRKLSDTTPFITTANLLVTELLGSSSLSSDLLTEIERYLAAHLVALHPDERQIEEQEIGDTRDKYVGKFAMGLQSTQFGQTVLMLDTTGVFASQGLKAASLDVISVPYDPVL